MTSPLERLRILQQTSSPEYLRRGIVDSLKYMYTKEGVKGLFRGNGINTVIQAPFTALEFYFYEVFKNNLYDCDRSQLTFQ